MRSLLAWLRHRWDVGQDPAQPTSFAAVRPTINLKRLEFVGGLMIANEGFQAVWALSTGRTAYLQQTGVNAAIDLAIVLLARWTLRHGSARLKAWVPPVCVVVMLLTFQASVAVLAAGGRLSSTYPLALLATALLFVSPPRILAAIVASTSISFAAIVWHAPVPMTERAVTFQVALFAAILAVVAGSLIHGARERDHDQKNAIRDRNRRLVRHNEEMEEVMAFAAHDLRSPLLGLRNLVAFARPRIATDPALASETLAEAERSLEAALALIGRLLAAHEAEYGPVHPAVGDLRLALTAAAERNRPLANTHGVTLHLILPDRPLMAHADPGLLARVLDNLVTNAVRFSPEGGTVTLRGERDAGSVRLAVEDEGPGIQESERVHLFQKFRCGLSASTGGSHGTGMGLFIARTLVERLGGRLSHQPVTPHGCRFEICLEVTSSSIPKPFSVRSSEVTAPPSDEE